MATRTGVIAGKAFVVIEAIDKTATVLNKIRTSLRNFANEMQHLGTIMLKVGILTALPMGMSVKTFGDIEELQHKVSKMVPDPAKYMEPFVHKAEGLATEYGLALKDIYEAMYTTLSAGAEPADLEKMMEQGAKGAMAGSADLQQTMKAVVAMMTAYKLKATEVSKVTDMMFTADRLGGTNFKEMSEEIGRIANVMDLAGMSMEEFFATLATLTRAQIPTDVVVTGLRGAVMEFFNPGEIKAGLQKKIEAAFGKGVKFDANLQAVFGLTNVLQMLKAKGVTTTELASMFPDARRLNTVLTLFNNLDTQIANMDEMMRSSGATNVAWMKMADTLNFKLRQLWQNVILVAYSFGEVLAPTVKFVTDTFSVLLVGVRQFITEHKGLVLSLAMSSIGIIALGALFTSLGLTLRLVAFSMLPIVAAFRLLDIVAVGVYIVLTRPFIWLMKLIPMVGRLILWLASAPIRLLTLAITALNVVSSGIISVILLPFTLLKTLVISLLPAIASLVSALLSMGPVAIGILTTMILLRKVIWGLSLVLYDTLGRVLSSAVNEGRSRFTRFVTDAIPLFKSLGSTIMTTFAAVREALSIGDVQGAWGAGLAGLQVAWIEFTTILRRAWFEMTQYVLKIWSDLKIEFTNPANPLVAAITQLHQDIMDMIEGWKMIADYFGITGVRGPGGKGTPYTSPEREFENLFWDRAGRNKELRNPDMGDLIESMFPGLSDIADWFRKKKPPSKISGPTFIPMDKTLRKNLEQNARKQTEEEKAGRGEYGGLPYGPPAPLKARSTPPKPPAALEKTPPKEEPTPVRVEQPAVPELISVLGKISALENRVILSRKEQADLAELRRRAQFLQEEEDQKGRLEDARRKLTIEMAEILRKVGKDPLDAWKKMPAYRLNAEDFRHQVLGDIIWGENAANKGFTDRELQDILKAQPKIFDKEHFEIPEAAERGTLAAAKLEKEQWLEQFKENAGVDQATRDRQEIIDQIKKTNALLKDMQPIPGLDGNI